MGLQGRPLTQPDAGLEALHGKTCKAWPSLTRWETALRAKVATWRETLEAEVQGGKQVR